MKLRFRIVLALYAGFLFSSLLQFFWGDAGLFRMRTLEDHREKLVGNIEKLEEIHRDLVLERDALLYDEAEIEVRVTELGFYRDDEVPVTLPIRAENRSSRTLGTLVGQIPPSNGNKHLFRLFFLSASAIVFAATFLWRKHGTNNFRR